MIGIIIKNYFLIIDVFKFNKKKKHVKILAWGTL